jgi:hypothetical protein
MDNRGLSPIIPLQTDMVPDNFKPWWKFWPTKQQSLKRYGQIIVY